MLAYTPSITLEDQYLSLIESR